LLSVALKYNPPVLEAMDSKSFSSISTFVKPYLKEPSGFKAIGARAFPLLPSPIVYVFIPNERAKSAEVFGSINHELLTPSVSKIITLLLALLFLSLLTEVAKPIPIAVPSSIIPSKIISSKDLTIIDLSVVTGVLV